MRKTMPIEATIEARTPASDARWVEEIGDEHSSAQCQCCLSSTYHRHKYDWTCATMLCKSEGRDRYDPTTGKKVNSATASKSEYSRIICCECYMNIFNGKFGSLTRLALVYDAADRLRIPVDHTDNEWRRMRFPGTLAGVRSFYEAMFVLADLGDHANFIRLMQRIAILGGKKLIHLGMVHHTVLQTPLEVGILHDKKVLSEYEREHADSPASEHLDSPVPAAEAAAAGSGSRSRPPVQFIIKIMQSPFIRKLLTEEITTNMVRIAEELDMPCTADWLLAAYETSREEDEPELEEERDLV